MLTFLVSLLYGDVEFAIGAAVARAIASKPEAERRAPSMHANGDRWLLLIGVHGG